MQHNRVKFTCSTGCEGCGCCKQPKNDTGKCGKSTGLPNDKRDESKKSSDNINRVNNNCTVCGGKTRKRKRHTKKKKKNIIKKLVKIIV